MTLSVYTSQYKYDKDCRLDITVKTGIHIFAPTWDMVMDHKDGKITDKEYTDMYYAKMRESYKHNKDYWEWLLKQDKVVLVCFCKPGNFCHRYLLANILEKLGAKYEGEI
jgi:hypothetical protein